MSDWVNWQEFSDLQKPEIQRQEDERNNAMDAQGAALQKALMGLGREADSQVAQGAYRGASTLGSYSDVMRQRDAALAADNSTNALRKAPWETDLGAGQGQRANPWASLTSRLGGFDEKNARQSTDVANRKAAEERFQSAQEFNRRQAEKLAAAQDTKSQAARDYTIWSDRVQSRQGAGGSAYYDAAKGIGPQPVSVYASPAAKRRNRQVYGASEHSMLPESSSSNFGLNKGYSGGNDWNF